VRLLSPMILIIDNYDSFIYNIAHYCEALGAKVRVARNDAITPDEIIAAAPSGLIISPGPCSPDDSGVSLRAIRPTEGMFPVLGVCLGHQAIAQAYGANIIRIPPVHGKTSAVTHDGSGLLRGLPLRIRAARYHSLAVDSAGLPPCLKATAHTDDGVIMALRHAVFPTYGLQFHPESIASDGGYDIIGNFLEICTAFARKERP